MARAEGGRQVSAQSILRECGFASADEVRRVAERNRAPKPPERDYTGYRFVRVVGKADGEVAR